MLDYYGQFSPPKFQDRLFEVCNSPQVRQFSHLKATTEIVSKALEDIEPGSHSGWYMFSKPRVTETARLRLLLYESYVKDRLYQTVRRYMGLIRFQRYLKERYWNMETGILYKKLCCTTNVGKIIKQYINE